MYILQLADYFVLKEIVNQDDCCICAFFWVFKLG